jgi:uncharacterized YkwD family protein
MTPKKWILASALFLAATPLAHTAEAASYQPTETKTVYVNVQSNLDWAKNVDWSKWMNEYKTNCFPGTSQPTQKEVQVPSNTNQATPAPAAPVAKPATPSTPAPAAPAAKPDQSTSTSPSAVSAFEKEVVSLTNAERAKNGLPALKLDTKLSSVAKKKAEDMQKNNYFSHTSPTYGSPFDMMKQFGVSYQSAGENIAQGQSTPKEVVQAWMNSEGHRANILNKSFGKIGVGHTDSGHYWSQMFTN